MENCAFFDEVRARILPFTEETLHEACKSEGRWPRRRLVIVNWELTHAVKVPDIARTMQEAIGQWAAVEPALRAALDALNRGTAKDGFGFVFRAIDNVVTRA